MSRAPLVEPVRRVVVEPKLAESGSGDQAQPELLTVDSMVNQRTLGSLAGDIHNGPWNSPSYHAPGHNLQC